MEKIIAELDDFNREKREDALLEIVKLIKAGKIGRTLEAKGYLNLHIHTFHSFNYKNWSPSRIVFEGWKTGLEFTGTVDFDTLAGLEETLYAGKLLGLKVVGGFETRAYLPELKDKVINSPKEPGIYYLCGKGFKKQPEEGSEEWKFFKEMKEIAQKRNKRVIEKLNEYLGEVSIDYKKDVLPLTPSNNPTERHIVVAYQKKSEKILGEKVDDFWADIFKMEKGKVEKLRKEKPEDFQELLRKKLIKYGGPGYIKPEPQNFPVFDKVVEMTEKAGGIPIGTWLDGTNPGEENPEELVELLKSKRIRGITIIPERNWNIKEQKEREIKVKNLHKFMEVCRKMEMPVICGTEMNKFGQPFVDNFKTEILSKYLPYFLESAEKLFFKKI
ncbi:hypothetical protein J7L87_03565 [bacterium]|nr:hypothetical protein [bacterium]